MTYSETELQQIEKYASIYLKISDIAEQLGQVENPSLNAPSGQVDLTP